MALPTVTSTAAAAAGVRIDNSRTRLAQNFETFLTLLTAQLKNQDPLSPLDGNQFTEQLVQMSSVEQQLLTNDLLKSLVGQAGGAAFDGALDMIGRTVTAEGGDAALTKDGASWLYEIPRAALSATLEVRNAAGELVWSGSPPDTGRGRHPFVWDGSRNGGGTAPAGVYTLTVRAQSEDGRAMAGKTWIEGVVTGVEQVDGTTTVTVGGTQIPVGSVGAVRATG